MAVDRAAETRVAGRCLACPTRRSCHACHRVRATNTEPYLFNHAMRSWLFAVASRSEQSRARRGSPGGGDGAPRHRAGGSVQRPAAIRSGRARMPRGRSRSGEGSMSVAAQLIWDGVALNSTPSIALYKETEVAMCTAGIGLDWGGWGYEALPGSADRGDPRYVSAAGHEAALHARRLPHRRNAPRHDLRQLRAGFRRALRARATSGPRPWTCCSNAPFKE